MATAVIVPAAGLGVRMGPGAPKALRGLAGEPLLVHAVRSLWSSGVLDTVVVAAPPGQSEVVRELVLGAVAGVDLVVVDGAATRRASVSAGLDALPARAPGHSDVDVVLVHDAARPLVPVDLVQRVVAAVRDGAAAVVPVLPVVDTVKQVAGRVVVGTIDRSHLRAVQTPQGFTRDVLARAHVAASTDKATDDATDDAGLVEALGIHVNIVDGSPEALKVTRDFDLRVAAMILRSRSNLG